MNKGTKLYELSRAAEKLFTYLDHVDSPAGADRDKVMHLVHELNAAYVEWGFELDVEHLRAPRDFQLDDSADLR